MLPFWLGVSCLFLFTSGREGRVYSGRKKTPAMTGQRLRSGPHVCYSGMGGGCCPGWTVSPINGQCLQPLCSFGCGSGFCIAPNVCSCRDGRQGVTCSDDFLGDYNKDLEDKGISNNCLSAMCDQNCRLVNGLPMCSCYHGYGLGKDGKSCYDIDECSRSQVSNLCQQQCKNSIGSYRCFCYYGYQISPNGRSCIPNKHPNTIAAPAPCGEYGCELTCNDGGCEHTSRVCPVGFSMTETENGVTCTDIDECASSSCEGSCMNTEGGFVCDCGPGLKLAADRRSCYDIDECSAHRSPCQQRCKNLHGSYKCLCAVGFTLHSNGHTCADINECRRPATSHLCQHTCHNTHGSFFCTCRTGYVPGPDKLSCVDVDECLEDTTLCSFGSCVNTVGSYHCSCPTGFLPSDTGCSEIPLEMQTTNLPQETQASHGEWAPLKPTSQAPPSFRTSSITASQTLPTSTITTQEHLTTMSTSTTQSTLTDFDSLLPPQHLRTNHFPLAQKASGISHMPMKEDMLLQPGTPSVPDSSSYCWHNKELHLTGSSWADPGCLDCTCKDGNISCEPRTCHLNCSHPVLHPDSCCPSCHGCLFDGLSRADGELFSKSPDNCTICICLSGNVTCIPPECPLVTCADPFMSDCCLRCPDECEFQGQVYPHGARFSRDENGCTSCLCQNGAVECSFLPCPSLDCPREDWVLEVGQCCYKCQEPPQSSGCPFDDNGIEIPVGQIWSPGDPCSICICQADSSIVCKKTDCLETCPHPIPVPGQCCPDCSAGCFYGRRTFRNNESFLSTSDPCLTCICLMGTVACSPIECALSCTYPFHDEGECCPVCRDCTYDGRKVLNGQTFQLESDPCTQCTCQSGEVECEAISCTASCTHPYIFPGDCCSTCEECVFEGHVLENGGSYILKTEPCVVCHCSGGNILCERREGSCPSCEQKTQDCLNELPEFQHSDTRRPDILQKLEDFTVPSQSSRLSLFQKRKTVTARTIQSHPTPFISLFQTKSPLNSVSQNSAKTILSNNAAYYISHTDMPYVQAPELPPKESVSLSLYGESHDMSLISLPPLTSKGISDIFTSPPPVTTETVPTFPLPVVAVHNPSSQSTTVSSMSLAPISTHPSECLSSSSLTSVHASSPSATHASLPYASLRPGRLSEESTHYPLLPTHAPDPARAKTDSLIPNEAGPEKQTEMKNDGMDAGQITGCSINGSNFTSGSIFIADVDYCLQCECLKGEVYCKPETLFCDSLCCQGCSNPPVDSCVRETNQVHSQWGEAQQFCKCKMVVLQCQSCSYIQGCSREVTSQSSESVSEQITKEDVRWIPLIFAPRENLTEMNPGS
ncbi:von Willebrand factor C and EGF domain-containing protein [Discoglossus pictus]